MISLYKSLKMLVIWGEGRAWGLGFGAAYGVRVPKASCKFFSRRFTRALGALPS